MLKNLIFLIILLGLSVAFIRHLELRNIFFPMRTLETTPKSIGLDYEDVFFKAGDGVILNGWLIRKPVAVSTLIFFHGNAGNISHRLEKIVLFHRLGLNVFIVDYRGFGKSQGRPSEEGMYRDAQAAFDYLLGRSDIKNKIIAYGESIGSAAAIDLCLHRKVDGLIIDSAFTSAKDMARVVYPFIPSFLVLSRFDSIGKIKSVKIPKLFIHSLNDEIVPFWQGEKLFQAASSPKEFLKVIGGHNSGFAESQGKIEERLRHFLAEFSFI